MRYRPSVPAEFPALARARQVARLAPRAVERPALGRLRRVLASAWTLGVMAAVASWNLRFTGPIGGLDPSWAAGLYMAADRGMDFGTQLVFPFGPLGFLHQPWLWYGDLAVLAFMYSGILRIALSVSLVWALRRTLGGAAAFVLTFLILVVAPSIEIPMVLAAVWCLAALSPDPPPFARPLVVFGGAALGAIETLVVLRSGPVILAMCSITLLAEQRWRRDLPVFIGCSALGITLLWLAAGQGLGNLPDFVRTAPETISGYSEAMGVPASSGLHLPVILMLGSVLVAAAAWTSAAGRARLAAAAAIGLAAFLLYKEAIVRAEPVTSPCSLARPSAWARASPSAGGASWRSLSWWRWACSPCAFRSPDIHRWTSTRLRTPARPGIRLASCSARRGARGSARAGGASWPPCIASGRRRWTCCADTRSTSTLGRRQSSGRMGSSGTHCRSSRT